ncbi:MAG: DUF4974 domain-containing protein [Bacteroidales bacterium]|nr:DUF4974 domain-containing protein [Bacteroidales bacterium]
MTSDDIKSWFYGECSAERRAEMEDWFVANIDSPLLDATLNEILKSCDKADRERTLKAFLDTCHRLGIEPPVHRSSKNAWRIALGGMAAALVGFVIGVSIQSIGDSAHKGGPEWVEVYTNAGTTNTVLLPDSSSLRLSPASVLIYDSATFAECREVYLHGGAYAEITRDSEHPFVIKSNQASIAVLGTRFDFSNYTDDTEMEVRLYEGKVTVLSGFAETTDTLNLIPGEVIKVDRKTGHHNIFDIRGLESHSTGSFHFINKELCDIANELSRYFDADILIENEDVKHRKFYAIFANGESLPQILDGLNASGQMDVSFLDSNTVIIR